MTQPATETNHAAQLAERLGTDDPAKQLQQLDELLTRVQFPPAIITISYDLLRNEAQIVGVSADLPYDALQLALSRAQQTLTQRRMAEAMEEARHKQAEASAPVARGRRKGAQA